MTDYASEAEGALQIRRDRGDAANADLTPTNVRRIYGSVRTPRQRTMASPRQRSSAAEVDDTLAAVDDEGRAMLDSIFPPRTTGVGMGATTTTTSAAAPIPSTSGLVSGIGMGATTRPISVGKEPRTLPSPRSRSRLSRRRQRAVRAASVLRRANDELRAAGGRDVTAAGAGGGDDDDDDSDSSSSGRRGRGRRGLQNDLNRLLGRLRRRADGRHIAGITHTDTITTTYKDGRPPTVTRSSSRASGT